MSLMEELHMKEEEGLRNNLFKCMVPYENEDIVSTTNKLYVYFFIYS